MGEFQNEALLIHSTPRRPQAQCSYQYSGPEPDKLLTKLQANPAAYRCQPDKSNLLLVGELDRASNELLRYGAQQKSDILTKSPARIRPSLSDC